MDSTIVSKIENKLNSFRLNAQLKHKILIDNLYKNNPPLLELENNKRIIASDYSIKKEEKNQKINEIDNKIAVYLKENNLIMPQIEYKCSCCNDTGYVLKNGKNVRCNCFYKMVIDEALKDESLLNFPNFNDFNENIFADEIKSEITNIRNYAEKYADKFPNVKKTNIVFCGDTGTGKTFLLSCIYTELKKKGLSVVYITAGKLFEILRKYAFNEINDISVLTNSDMLIIDDLGTEPMFNNITVEYMFLLFNERKINNKPMCISTNLNPDEIKNRYTERIASRLFDKETTNVIKIPGNDLRLR